MNSLIAWPTLNDKAADKRTRYDRQSSVGVESKA